MEHAKRRYRCIPFLALAPILGTFYYYPRWRRKKRYQGVNIFDTVEIKYRTYIIINVRNSNYFELNILSFEFYKFGYWIPPSHTFPWTNRERQEWRLGQGLEQTGLVMLQPKPSILPQTMLVEFYNLPFKINFHMGWQQGSLSKVVINFLISYPEKIFWPIIVGLELWKCGSIATHKRLPPLPTRTSGLDRQHYCSVVHMGLLANCLTMLTQS